MAEQALESRLKMVKENVYAALAKGEVELYAYCDMIDRMLSEESFYATASASDRLTFRIKVAVTLEPKLGLIEQFGLEKKYVARKDVPLSEAAQKDLDEFKRLKDSAKAYVEAEFGDKPFTPPELEDKIHKYLMNYHWPFKPMPKNISEMVGRLGVLLPLEMQRKPKAETKVICGYDEEMLKRVLDEI